MVSKIILYYSCSLLVINRYDYQFLNIFQKVFLTIMMEMMLTITLQITILYSPEVSFSKLWIHDES